MSNEVAEAWVRQFRTISPKLRQKLKQDLMTTLDRLEREARSEIDNDIMLTPINTYWFEREHSRLPDDNEVRPWELHLKMEYGQIVLKYPSMAYHIAINKSRRQATEHKRQGSMKGKLRSIEVHVSA